MAAIAKMEPSSLPSLVREAATRLASAQTSAEVLDARHAATAAYDAAKSAARIAHAKKAHDEIIVAVYRAQGDALEIESMAKRRLADEYDAAQNRGEVSKGRPKSIPGQNTFSPTVSDLGFNSKDIHEARQVRDAEVADPGIVRRTVDRIIDRGEEPTRAAVRREIVAPTIPRQPVISDDATWLWGRCRDFERDGYFQKSAGALLAGMTDQMRADVRRLAPQVREFFEGLEVACDRA